MRKPRILIVASARQSTGFGRVVNGLSDRLSPFYDIHVLGYDVFAAAPGKGWTLHPGSPLDVFGIARLGELHAALRPDLTLFVNDFWFVPAFLGALRRSPHQSKVALYIPIDGLPRDPHQLDPVTAADAVAVYTNFGRRVVSDALAATGPPRAYPPLLETIPHAIATETFRPLVANCQRLSDRRQRLAARRALLGEDPRVDGFWVLNANKNSRRKRLDLTMIGFALFARDKPPNVRLYLHAGRRDTGQDLQRLARNLQLGDRLIVTADTDDHPELGFDRLNLVYNACEVGVNTSIGEGWGLVAFEHGATGAAQVVPKHSALPELWRSAAVFLEPTARVPFGCDLEGGAVMPEALAAALERLYGDREYLAEMSAASYSQATRQEWSWQTVAPQWDRFFQAVLARPSTSRRSSAKSA
jgi:D-inositol-3-phosphate glycosyltransferase